MVAKLGRWVALVAWGRCTDWGTVQELLTEREKGVAKLDKWVALVAWGSCTDWGIVQELLTEREPRRTGFEVQTTDTRAGVCASLITPLTSCSITSVEVSTILKLFRIQKEALN